MLPLAGRTAAYALLLLLTAEFTVWGAVLTLVHVGDTPVPIGILVAATNVPLCRAGGALTGQRLGAAGPAVLWLLLVLPMLSLRREGDLVVTGSLRGVAFLLVGALSAAVTVGVWRPASPARPDSRSTSRGDVAR